MSKRRFNRRRYMGIRGALRHEARLVAREQRALLAIVLIAPIFYAFFYGSVYLHKAERDVPIAVVDQDHSALSRRLVRSLDAHQNLAVARHDGSLEAARAALLRMEVHGIAYIPAGFGAAVQRREGDEVKVFVDASRFLITNDLSLGFSEVVGTLSAGARIRMARAQGQTAEQARTTALPIEGVRKPLFNPAESYGDFMLPGLLGLILQQVLLMAVGLSAASDRERGRLARLPAVTGGRVLDALTGKLLFYVLIFGAYALFFFTVVLDTFRLQVEGSTLALVAATVLLLIAVAGGAFFVGSFFRRAEGPLQFFILTTYPFFLLSGYSWPLSAMPAPVRLLAQGLPSTPYLRAVMRIVQMGAGWSHVAPELLHLSVLALVAVLAACLRLRHLSRRSEAMQRAPTP